MDKQEIKSIKSIKKINKKNIKKRLETIIEEEPIIENEKTINLIKNLTAKQTQTLKAWTGLEIGN